MSGTDAPTTMTWKDGAVRTKRGSTGDCVSSGEKQLSGVDGESSGYRDYCRCSCGCDIELDPTQRGPTRLR